MKATNPYSHLTEKAFWRTAVAECPPDHLARLYTKKFNILASDAIAAAGSCFAQHISRHLRTHHYNVVDYEPCPSDIAEHEAHKFGYNMYSARFGNIYTVHQLLQLVREAADTSLSENFIWERHGRYYDAFRPTIEPGGFSSKERVIQQRQIHIARLKEMLCDMDVFIFTLGMTESWRCTKTGTVFPMAPGVVAGNFDKSEFEFINFSAREIKSAFEEFLSVLQLLRGDNRSDLKVILTVSPVPLTATASGHHVLRASTYSKSVLRTVAEELYTEHPLIDYFPSFEIITNQAAKGGFYQENFRSVKSEGVNAVMQVFFGEHTVDPDNALQADQPQTQPSHSVEINDLSAGNQQSGADSRQAMQNLTDWTDPNCDEILLEAFEPVAQSLISDKGQLVFIGNSHLAGIKQFISKQDIDWPIEDTSWFVPGNWLESEWHKFETNDYLRSLVLKEEFQHRGLTPPQSLMNANPVLVFAGINLMGDGVIRAFGNLAAGNESTADGRDISPTIPFLDNSSSAHVKKRYEKYFDTSFKALHQLVDCGLYPNIFVIEAPDMTERTARFRLGDEFVDSGSYRHYKAIARQVISMKKAELDQIHFIRHPDRFLTDSGFTQDRYAANSRLYDIHVSREFYKPALETLKECLVESTTITALPDSFTGPVLAGDKADAGSLSMLRSLAGRLGEKILRG